MELRVLRYFVTVVDEGSITDAAKILHVTQPTLSRQLAQMEQELGTPLFVRGRGGIALTERGAVLNQYARSLLDLADKAEEAVAIPRGNVAGTVRIGAGETRAFSVVAEACARVRRRHPHVTFNVHDGTSADLKDQFARGFYDFLLDCSSGENTDFNQLTLPMGDVLGVVMRADDPLCACDEVRMEDLVGRDVIASPAMTATLRRQFVNSEDRMPHVVCTYGLPLNARYLVLAGMGVMITFDELVSGPDASGGGPGDAETLCFRPLSPRIEMRHKILWRKVMPTRAAQALIDELQQLCR